MEEMREGEYAQCVLCVCVFVCVCVFLCVCVKYRTMKPFVIVLGGVGGERWWGNLTNVQCKTFHKYHDEFPLYN
jgi:hypothetical protein